MRKRSVADSATQHTKTPVLTPPTRTSISDFLHLLRWLDLSPMLDHVEPYRRKILHEALDTVDDDGRMHYNLIVTGRAKKNYKSCDLCLASLFALLANDSIHGNDVLVAASDEDQAGDDLSLVRKLVQVSPYLSAHLDLYEKSIVRKDKRGTLRIIPGGDVRGAHGKTAKLVAVDEIHTQRDWSLLEALALDPTRPDSQMWITSYASLYHRKGVPLHDLAEQGKRGGDPRLFFSWYASDFTTDPDFQGDHIDGETCANPSQARFAGDYLVQQRRRLPTSLFDRLHLNLPGSPEGNAYTIDAVTEAVQRGVRAVPYERGVHYDAYVDMSFGSKDDSVLAIAYRNVEGKAVLARIVSQGQPPPFDPYVPVEKFASVMHEYGCRIVYGDRLGGQTFLQAFYKLGITYEVSVMTASEIYTALEPVLNHREVHLLDAPELEAQLLGLVWKGNKIDHATNEHDDWANAAGGALLLALTDAPVDTEMSEQERYALWRMFQHPGEIDLTGVPDDEINGSVLKEPS